MDDEGREDESASDVVDTLIQQSNSLCKVHDHITRVIGSLDFSDTELVDEYSTAKYNFEGMLRLMLYEDVCRFSQREVVQRIEIWPYLLQRFGLDRPPRQQTLSHTRRNRLCFADRRRLSDAATGIRRVAEDHGLLEETRRGPPIDPSEKSKNGLTADEVDRAVRIARDRLFTAFSTGRAANAKYPDSVFWEIQSYLSMTAHGKRKTQRRTERLAQHRRDFPHSDTHTRALKKIGAPDPQVSLSDFEDGVGPQQWSRIRKTLLNPFDQAIENLFEETDLSEGIREPVNVAIDVMLWEFHPSPWKNRKLEIPREDFPEMVSGYKGPTDEDPGADYERGYKFATLTIIGKDTPIVLAIEPVKDRSRWESGDVQGMSKGLVVHRLLSKAERYVDINKVMIDREFDALAVRDTIDQRGMTYLIPKRTSAAEDIEGVEKTKAHPKAKLAVEHATLTYNDRTHETHLIYFKSSSSGSYAIMTTNAARPTERAAGLVAQYKDRWVIENEYKSIKEHFLPRTTSTDYRVRLFYFIAAVLMYNVWRVTNLLLRSWFDVHLGDKPPVPAGEVTEIMALCLDTGIG